MSQLTGCIAADAGEEPAESPPEGESVSAVAEAMIASNAIAPNAIAPNAIAPNAIAPNAIAPNAIAPNAMSPAAFAALLDPGLAGDLSRQLVRFAVGCALTPNQSFRFTWTDDQGVAHDEVYPGLLGLAPGWAIGPLGEVGQRVVSACLAARTNYSGASVLVSMRSEIPAIDTKTTAAERAQYPYLEGAFWGNLFSPSPHLHACYVAQNIPRSRAALRECASGHVDAEGGPPTPCGPIVIEGPCSAVCARFDAPEQLYDHCLERPGSGSWARTSWVITTALP